MAIRKALVMNSGQIEQLQSGDDLDINGSQGFTGTNANAGALVIGTPVYLTAASTVDKAKADAVGTVNVIGLMQPASTAAAGTGFVQIDGVLTATTGQWDAVTGGSGGLTFNSFYYLDQTTAGKLTSTAPTTTGQFVKEVGIALSTTDLKIEIGQRVKL